MKLVMVEWVDTAEHHEPQWVNLEKPFEDAVPVCRSVGWLVLDGEKKKVLVQTALLHREGDPRLGSGLISIPCGCILHMVELQDSDMDTHPLGPLGPHSVA